MEEMKEKNESVTRDESFDVSSLLTQVNQEKTNSEKNQSESETPKKSALDLAIEHNKTKNTGIIVDSADEEYQPVELRLNHDTDAFREGFKNEVKEQEELIHKAKLVYAIKRPENQGEYAEMITEISNITEDENGVHIPDGARYIKIGRAHV